MMKILRMMLLLLFAIPVSGADAAESRSLDIRYKRLVRENYAAATAVEFGAESSLHVQVGAAIRATRMVLELHNVRGSFVFVSHDEVLAPLRSRLATFGNRTTASGGEQ